MAAPHGWLALQFLAERHEVEVMLAPGLAPQLGRVIAPVRHALDLDADPALIDPVLAALPLPAVPGIRVPGGM